ncbi:MAG: hypothetical protein COX79_05310 [Candidatus Levybacteria bacterium CG_4_10_14_0_2_um_filter_36_16]|nr:MAG: hypothetical protein AUK12_00450 [Candidatus Levybacteria bacterium CG2_30_37_29]PIR79478.1 MAG: hypothetical protein COU26_00910 [Candidatus Levybacteria bacterium CG10_big_fil_rev_8_21_14_0_10_36_30]PIZ96369.1 MAG: hypothetical protein COX79_05310 [Candidatus Levybacteria bacterium CG_4_10_14_0_2_um_filter_36_16]PJA90347.1 MAG: hypothetical protein CO136_02460 [Candidatus Levybacteria bacterium CG_4_9_14_3_um_filter_36_7]
MKLFHNLLRVGTYRYYVLVFLVSSLPLTAFFITTNLVHTSDGLVHVPRIAAFYKALVDGQFPVRWAGDLNFGYGMPLFNFMYQLPYLVSSFFIVVGFDLVSSFKLSMATSFLLSGFFIFLFAREFFKDEKKALLITLLYQFAPFHLVELLVRGSFGELYTYTFLPLVLFGLTKIINKPTVKSFVLTSVATFFLIISHNAISLVFFGVCLFYILFFAPRKKWLVSFASLFFGLGLSAYYFIPAIFEHKYTYGDLYMKDLYKSHFVPLYYFFVPNILKSQEFRIGAVSVQFGLFHVLAIIAGFFAYTRRKRESGRIILFCLILVGVSLFFMQPISKILWERLTLLRQFQFPWRFISVVVFATSFLGVTFFEFKKFSKHLVFVSVCIFIVLSTVFYWVPQEGFDKINENYYRNFPLTTTYYGETDVIWTAGEFHSYPKKPVETIEGNAIVSNYKKKSNVHTYIVVSQKPSKIVDHTEYFPGWKVYVNGKQTSIEFQDQNYRGEITFAVPAGSNDVKVVFGESPIRAVSDGISILSFAGIIGYVGFRKVRKKR